MAYRIHGLAQEQFAPLLGSSDEVLACHNARRVIADKDRGFPCRVSLEEARVGDPLILLNFASHDVPTPFRTTYAIYVRERPVERGLFVDEIPDVLQGRTLGLRGFDAEGMFQDARLALPGEADREIRALLDRPEIASIHAHTAAHGCFLARIERS